MYPSRRWLRLRSLQYVPLFPHYRSRAPADISQFGEEYRPVKLVKQIIGFDVSNEWVLNSRLDKELWPVLQRSAAGKPVLVFCATRRGRSISAQQNQANLNSMPIDGGRDRSTIRRDQGRQTSPLGNGPVSPEERP